MSRTKRIILAGALCVGLGALIGCDGEAGVDGSGDTALPTTTIPERDRSGVRDLIEMPEGDEPMGSGDFRPWVPSRDYETVAPGTDPETGQPDTTAPSRDTGSNDQAADDTDGHTESNEPTSTREDGGNWDADSSGNRRYDPDTFDCSTDGNGVCDPGGIPISGTALPANPDLPCFTDFPEFANTPDGTRREWSSTYCA